MPLPGRVTRSVPFERDAVAARDEDGLRVATGEVHAERGELRGVEAEGLGRSRLPFEGARAGLKREEGKGNEHHETGWTHGERAPEGPGGAGTGPLYRRPR